ncbi:MULTISPECIES: chromosomal replication initiator protein DnaA [Limnobacter]|uniref:chromosomal replication initiator protein DnaA n=1 Tax=Limnobacter TaxID=131079 RepID=UPI0024E0CF54|nr:MULTISPECIES: chromosomal replication initiator protein DnaA [Limnobacter]HEX5485485.1 chromosomal replication initiator protein DnaA [Limnobacter sp.]
MEQFWTHCVEALKKEIPAQQIKLWIDPLSIVEFDEDQARLVMAAPNRFKLDWVVNNYGGRFNQMASDYFGCDMAIEWQVASKTTPASPMRQTPQPGKTSSESVSPKLESIRQEEIAASVYERSRLNKDLCFSNFVSGRANQLARAAAEQVANNPGVSYNPLFLYGGVGLGKTHLIHSIGNKLLERNPQASIRYIHAEQYVSDVVKAYQKKAFEEFKRSYYSLDLLLIDDIQFFAGKSRTQEEFFYAFEQLIAAKKQIIITSDTYPKEIQGIEDRLISRFNSGLTVAIEPPELEMRVAILLKKAEQQQVKFGEDVAFFVAKHMRSNVRELEGALRRIMAFASFHNKTVTMDLVREALRDMISVHHGQVSVESIQKTVADYYKIKVADMFSKRRQANIVLPRQVAMYLAKELTDKSYVEIGELFGGRDHTTVLHAVNKISEMRNQSAELNHALHVLDQTLKG